MLGALSKAGKGLNYVNTAKAAAGIGVGYLGGKYLDSQMAESLGYQAGSTLTSPIINASLTGTSGFSGIPGVEFGAVTGLPAAAVAGTGLGLTAGAFSYMTGGRKKSKAMNMTKLGRAAYGATAMGLAGMAMNIGMRASNRLAQRMLQEGTAGFRPVGKQTPPTRRRVSGSAVTSRVASYSGARGDMGFNGNSVLSLHKTGGRGPVYR